MRRILSLSGGGVRGIVSVAFLKAIETRLQEIHAPGARLCDHFDLVGGTSTGGLIATAVALGRSADEIADFFLVSAPQLFGKPRRWRAGLAPIFDTDAFEAFVREEVGELTLGAPELQTRLAVTLKRIDTGSPWIASNVDTAPYFNDPEDGSFVGNRHFQLADLLMATTSIPGLFAPRRFHVASGQPVGVFVDGGLAGFGDPALALLQLAQLSVYGLRWPMGVEALTILSLGTGRFTASVENARAQAMGPIRLGIASAEGFHGDSVEQTRRLMTWMGAPVFPYPFDSEIGDLSEDTLTPEPLFRYAHLDLPLEADALQAAGLDVPKGDVKRLQSMTDPSVIADLHALATDWVNTQYPLDDLVR